MSTSSKAKILLIEDNPGDARLIRETLKEVDNSFDLEHVVRLQDGLERIQKGDIGMILLDLSLPDSSGIDAYIRVHSKAKHIPIIVITGMQDEELAVKAVSTGAQDYLVKGQIEGNSLIRAIRYAILRHATRADMEGSKLKLSNGKDLMKISSFDEDLSAQKIRAEVFSNKPISEYLPEMFEDLRNSYQAIIDRLADQESLNINKDLDNLIEELSTLDASPYDVMEIYSSATKTQLAATLNTDTRRRSSLVRASKHVIASLMKKMVTFYIERKKLIT